MAVVLAILVASVLLAFAISQRTGNPGRAAAVSHDGQLEPTYDSGSSFDSSSGSGGDSSSSDSSDGGGGTDY